MSSALTRRSPGFEHAAFAGLSLSGEWLQQRLRQTTDPFWLAALGVCLVSAVMVVGWPEAAGSITRSLMLGAGITSALAALLLAAHQAQLVRRARELRGVAHYQHLALEFGTRALACADVKNVLQEAAELIAQSLNIEYCAVLESALDSDDALVLRAGVGWPADSLDCRVVAEDGSSMRADHFKTGVWEHDSGVGSGITIRLQADSRTYGLLDICTSRHRVFSPEELDFVNSVGRLLGAAIERESAANSGDLPRRAQFRCAS